jgi:hypothetical protein
MRRWTDEGYLVTRRMVERHLDKVFAIPSGQRVMTHARLVGLVVKGNQGCGYDRPLTGRERAALILISALIAGTALTLIQAAELVASRQDWLQGFMAAAVTGSDLVIDHAVAGSLIVHVTIRNAVLRDPIIGVESRSTDQAAA